MAKKLRIVSIGERITRANRGVNRSQNIPNKNHAIIVILREKLSRCFSKNQAIANNKVNAQAKMLVTQIGETRNSNMYHWWEFFRRSFLRYSP
jgi:hypothetical protein